MENDLIIFESTIRKIDGLIFIKPLCDFFHIDYDNQVKRIGKDPILKNQTSKKTDKSLFGDKIPRLAVSKRGFVRWIQIINPQIVQVSLRKKFIDYQIRIFDYLYSSSIERDDQAAKDYVRLLKLKKLYSVIGNEIQRVDRNFKEYLAGKYVLDFNKKIEK